VKFPAKPLPAINADILEKSLWRLNASAQTPTNRILKLLQCYSNPNPYGNNGVSAASPVTTWALLRGHARGSRPVNLKSPNSTSVTPNPSVPGSQAAMKASLSARAEFKISGRPENNSVTTGRFGRRHQRQILRRQVQIGAVPLLFRIRLLSDDHDDGVGPLQIARAGRKGDLRPRGNRLAQGGQDRRAAGRHPAAPPLPVNRPTPALNAQIIRRRGAFLPTP